MYCTIHIHIYIYIYIRRPFQRRACWISSATLHRHITKARQQDPTSTYHQSTAARQQSSQTAKLKLSRASPFRITGPFPLVCRTQTRQQGSRAARQARHARQAWRARQARQQRQVGQQGSKAANPWRSKIKLSRARPLRITGPFPLVCRTQTRQQGSRAARQAARQACQSRQARQQRQVGQQGSKAANPWI